MLARADLYVPHVGMDREFCQVTKEANMKALDKLTSCVLYKPTRKLPPRASIALGNSFVHCTDIYAHVIIYSSINVYIPGCTMKTTNKTPSYHHTDTAIVHGII